jgi:hypothetical protein
LTVVSANSAPPFQPLRHQQKVYRPIVNRFMLQTLSTVNRKHLFMNILCIESFSHRKLATERCYLMIRLKYLLRPLQLFYFHLCPLYWLCLVSSQYSIRETCTENFSHIDPL